MMAETSKPKYGTYMYQGVRLPIFCTPDLVDKAANLDIKQNDVLVVSYPKTGSMWLREMLWLLYNADDMEASMTKPLMDRCPTIEMVGKKQEEPHPWLVHSHLPPRFLQKHLASGAKVLVVTRDPKDTLVSFYHFIKFMPVANFQGTWTDYFQRFKEGRIGYGDYFQFYEAWMPYVEKGDAKLIVYEDMKQDLRSVIKDVAAFLKTAVQEADVDKMLTYLSFDAMKANRKEMDEMLQDLGSPPSEGRPSGSYFRKGVVGDWKQHFTEEQQQYVDTQLQDSKLQNCFSHLLK